MNEQEPDIVHEEQEITISRRLLNENEFERHYHPIPTLKKNWYKSFYPPEPILTSIKPPLSKNSWKLFMMTHLPILNWIWNYPWNYFIGDTVAGLTIAIMRIPQSLAYALLAGLPPVYGLYASFVPVIVYSILGTSRHLSIGTFAVVCLMVYNGISSVLESDPNLQQCLDDNVSEILDYNSSNITCQQIKVQIATSLAFLSGVIMIILGVFQFGFITILLSESLISGYTTGAAIHVFTSQLQHIFGLKLSIRGLLSVPKIWGTVFYQVFRWPDYVNTATFVVSIISLTSLIVFRIIDKILLRKLKVICCFFSKRDKSCVKHKYKWSIPLPYPLVIVIIAAGISYGAKLNDTFNVAIVKDIPGGLPALTLPNWSLFSTLLDDAFIISIVTFSVSVSVSQVFAKQFDYTISSSQELIAYGAANTVGSFFSCMNTSGGLARTLIAASSGGKTQLVGFISSIVILIVLLFLGPLFEPLPNAVLACIIWVALYGMFKQVLDVWKYFKISIPDMIIWIVVFIATVLLGVDLGLAVGVVFSLCVVLIKIMIPKSSLLGRAPNTEIFRNVDNFEMVESVPGIVIYRFLAPLCFLNCKIFVKHLELLCNIKHSSKKDSEGIIPTLIAKYKSRKVTVDTGDLETRDLETNNNDAISSTNINRSTSYQVALENQVTDTNEVHTLILDCSPIGFIDAMGAGTLQQLVVDFDAHGIQVLFAALIKENRDMLKKVGFFDSCGKEWLFPSVQDAVNHSLLLSKLHPGGGDEQTESNEVQDNQSNVVVTEL